MFYNHEQTKALETEAREYLQERDCDWVTCEVDPDGYNVIYIYPDRLPENENEMEMTGSELLEIDCLKIVCREK